MQTRLKTDPMQVKEACQGCGPMRALQRVDFAGVVGGREGWNEKARLSAMLGNARHSLPCVKSGMHCYVAFV
eukprot:227084-Karenia_brevis.AAC.1